MRLRLFTIVVFVALLAVSTALVTLVLQPTREDMPVFALLLATPVVIAALGATIARQQAWWRQFRSVAVALFITYAISAGLILLTVYVTAQLMFISAHDATLALVFVIFATAVTLVFGYFVATSLRDGITDITRAARAVQRGDLTARADDQGSDELAELARSFNAMTAQLRRVRDQEARLNQARRDLIAWVSHDLRTPLTSIRARVEAMTDGVVTEPAEVSMYLNAVRNETYALSRLIDDLFELATIDAGGLKLEPVECQLSDLISDTIEMLGVLATERGITLTGHVAPDVDPVQVSPQHIQRVLNNLIGNALAHTKTGGSVRVEASFEPVLNLAKVLEPSQGSVRGVVLVLVCDNGEGIAPADLPHVFERFYRGERSRTRGDGNGKPMGMGLGLAIARALVEAHGGQIGIESQLEQGTTVWFTLAAWRR
ncbi:MAG: HAMP domain-containing histidine kinase [Chloroflexi bacterium]|nr:HAMP domain-containing histidine kinase [Chloroflexota bacterium]